MEPICWGARSVVIRKSATCTLQKILLYQAALCIHCRQCECPLLCHARDLVEAT